MVVIVGLGNAPREYDGTRHNVGYAVVGRLATLVDGQPAWVNKDHRAELKGTLNGQPVVLVKPLEFMNSSGQGVRAVMDYYHVPVSQIWVVYDDVNVALGSIRVRQVGSSGGHQGVASIIQHLGSGEFPHIRLGVGPLPTSTGDQGEFGDNELATFVLGKFNKRERKVIGEVVEAAARLIVEALPSTAITDVTTRV